MSRKKLESNISPQTSWQPEVPFDDLPPLPPAGELETKAVLKACITARAALAELKRSADLIPNPAILVNTLPLLEAQASSEIENIVTTTDRLFRYREASDHADAATKEALRYGEAMMEGFRSLKERPLTTRTAEQVCSRIKGHDMAVRKVPGTALANDATGRVVYTPPVGEARLRTLLGNWERFLHEAIDLDPLVRMAVGHYQFEAIHPFTDGNGRTGRVLNSLYLIEQGLLNLPILYLSRYIIDHKAEYYRLLLSVTREAAWLEWVLYLVRGVGETATWTVAKIEAIRTLMQSTVDNVRRVASNIYSRELIDAIFERPYCRIQNLVASKIGGRQTASRHLKQLVEAGVLEEWPVGREKLFVHPRLLGLLTRESNEFRPYP